MEHEQISTAIMTSAFGDLLPDNPSIDLVLIACPPDAADIIRLSAEYYGIDRDTMRDSRKRKGKSSRARQVACYLSRSLRKPHESIARAFGFDHSSVYAAAKRVEALLPQDEHLRDDIDILRLRMHDLAWSRIRVMTCH
jgi:chromosomal replication initiation ATPase DnaA